MAAGGSQRPTRPAIEVDDLVLPFQAERSRVMGRLVRLGPSVHDVLTRHDYPDAVSVVLGQALALTAMLGTTLDDGAKLILQTQTKGPLRFLVVNYEQPGNIRGYARFEADAVAAAGASDVGALLGHGHLALTIDLGANKQPYQGIVALEGETLIDAARIYFQQSAQLPTFIRLAVAKHFIAGADGRPGQWSWRAGGLMIQHLTPERGDEYKTVEQAIEDDDPWERTRILAATVEDHELLDPLLPPDRLLYRLFHEEGVRVYRSQPIAMTCRCSRERIERMLRLFSAEEVREMTEKDGSISVTCEFCSTRETFDKEQLAAVRAGAKS